MAVRTRPGRARQARHDREILPLSRETRCAVPASGRAVSEI